MKKFIQGVLASAKTLNPAKFGFCWELENLHSSVEEWRQALEALVKFFEESPELFSKINGEHAIIWSFRMRCIPKKTKRMLLKEHPCLKAFLLEEDLQTIGYTLSPKGTAWRAFCVTEGKRYKAFLFAGGHGLQARLCLKTSGLGAVAQAATALEENCGSVILRNELFQDFLQKAFGVEKTAECWFWT